MVIAFVAIYSLEIANAKAANASPNVNSGIPITSFNCSAYACQDMPDNPPNPVSWECHDIYTQNTHNAFLQRCMRSQQVMLGPSVNKVTLWDMYITNSNQGRTDSRHFQIGDSIIMPDGLKIQVIKVERNWQPPALVQSTYGAEHVGDNPAGSETVLVWFKATDVGNKPIVYSDGLFSLTPKDGHEQRVANLATLFVTDYGARDVIPWLEPTQSVTTFEPFLVKPNTLLASFQYYLIPSLAGIQKGGKIPDTTLTFVKIALDGKLQSVSSSGSVASQGSNYTFQPNTSVNVNP